jgi:hypothetical protein
MRKILFIIMLLFVTGCTSNNHYSGKVTEVSREFKDAGYIVNVFRASTRLEGEENSNKGYINMTFNVLVKYTSTYDFNEFAGYNVKKKTISNVRIIKTPKMGTVGDIIGNYDMFGGGIELVGSKNKFETTYEVPHTSGSTTSIAVKLDQIALMDPANYGYDQAPSLSDVYKDLDITRENVELTLGFRLELLTVDNIIYYKEYEIKLPPEGFDVAGDQFQIDKTITDLDQMEPFMQK